MPIPKPLLTGVRREFDIDRLVSMQRDEHPGTRTLFGLTLPPWQRPEVWTLNQKVRFIEGVMLGLGTGFYVTNELDFGPDGQLPFSGWLLDGQQRLSSLRDFIERGMVIFGDVTYQGMTPRERRKFLSLPFPAVELAYTDDESVLIELYDRLNYGGTPHELSAESTEFRAWKG